ncbi:MAG: hypothetical protein Q7S98_01180, partial [Deltaproteobacteria bacterium]|nr:hypothetical protein [Deltaproteobacteria bacterium]
MAHVLSLMTFFPVLGALLIPLLPKDKPNWARWTALVATLPPLFLAAKLFYLFDRTQAAFQFVEGPYSWVSTFNIQYYMGVDGISISMVLLTALISTICIIASWD